MRLGSCIYRGPDLVERCAGKHEVVKAHHGIETPVGYDIKVRRP